MNRPLGICAIALVVVLTTAQDVAAQFADAVRQYDHRPLAGPVQQLAQQQPGAWRPLRIAKWGVVAGTAGVALYGFVNNNRADDLYRELEEMCVADPARCENRGPDGSYVDAELETRYQEVLDTDSRARTALIVGQVGVAASVVLFILDLRNRGTPENIPYDPPGLSVTPARDGGYSLGWRVSVPQR